MRRQTAHGCKGFTLLEALLAAIVLALAVTAITVPFTAAAQHDQMDATRTMAVNLAQEMMEEILGKSFNAAGDPNTPGPEAGETRSTFDQFDDYHGYSEAQGQIADRSGAVIGDAAANSLSRTVSAQYTYVDGQDTGASATFIRITVTVLHKGSAMVTLSRLVYGGGA